MKKFSLRKFFDRKGITSLEQALTSYAIAKTCDYQQSEKEYRKVCLQYARRGNFVKREEEENGEISRTIKTTGEMESVIRSGHLITNVKEMAAFCNIDPNDFLPPKIVTNRWGNIKNPCWQFKVWWVPKYAENELKPDQAAKEMLSLLKDVKIPPFPKGKVNENGKTVVLGLTDVHIGLLTWGEEIGLPDLGNWDLNIATSELLKVIEFYCKYYREEDIKKFIVPIGSDLFNVNSELGTVNGTPQDEDCRQEKTFRSIGETMIVAIEQLSKIAPIDCLYIPGNHDKKTAYDLACGLAWKYGNNKRINFDILASDRKYIKIGQTDLGIGHGKVKGKEIKPSEIPALMARESRELWSQCKYHEFLLGHIHTAKGFVDEDFGGVMVRTLPAFTQYSYWIYSSGYGSIRQMYALEYDDEAGNIKTVVYRP